MYDMICKIDMQEEMMTIRKNFLFSEEIAKHLEELAAKERVTQTDIIRDMIEERYQGLAREEKLKAFRSIIPMPSGSLVGKSIQSIKADKNV